MNYFVTKHSLSTGDDGLCVCVGRLHIGMVSLVCREVDKAI